MYQPDQLPGRASIISRELQGRNSICLCLTGVLLWLPDSLHTLSWFASYRTFSVCYYSRYLSVSTPIPHPYMRQPMILNTLDRWPWCTWPGMAGNWKSIYCVTWLTSYLSLWCIKLSEAEFLDEVQTKSLKTFSSSYSQSPIQLCLEMSFSSNSRNLLQFM